MLGLESRLSTQWRAHGATQRRELTILFCDMVGSTELSGRLAPEALRDLVVSRLTAWTRIVERHGGYVARYMGDGLLAYFGYRSKRERHADDAAQAALDLLASNLRISGELTRIAARVGIATGTVVVGGVLGRGAAREEPVFGFAPNLAARLQAIASPNSAVISDETRRSLHGSFHCEALGGVGLKGIAEPVAAWRLLARQGELFAAAA